jgi:4-carboxymuconolactone decarboxylase
MWCSSQRAVNGPSHQRPPEKCREKNVGLVPTQGSSASNDRRATARSLYEDVMGRPFELPSTPAAEQGLLDFVFGQVWSRPGLSRRNRRWITLACAGAADTIGPIEANVYAALASGDIAFEEMQEFVLQFAVYCGWPKASFVDQVIWQQQAALNAERGDPPPETHPIELWNPEMDPEERMLNGAKCFADINHVPAPGRTSPYTTAGILNFVFGEVWQRPGLSVRDRRFITLACVGVDDAIIPIRSHFYSALKSRDVSLEEAQELVLHFAVHSGWPKASFLDQVVAESWTKILAEESDEMS